MLLILLDTHSQESKDIPTVLALSFNQLNADSLSSKSKDVFISWANNSFFCVSIVCVYSSINLSKVSNAELVDLKLLYAILNWSFNF
jgi:hypothetical protein